MTPQELKSSILQLAVQGRLVEQRPEEGTAEELYRQIQEEKQRLIKEGKIKKEKPLPEITEDEVPFDIPESWKWVRLADLCTIVTGKKDANFGSPDGQYFFFTCAKDPIRCASFSFSGESILLAGNGDISNISYYSGDFEAYQRTYVLQPFIENSYLYYLFYHLQYNWVQYNLDKIFGTAIPYIRLGNVQKYLVAFPPLAEQKRIVAKIEELLPYIDRYEKAWSKLEDFNKRFPGDMQKSVLQMAIQGKLVPQLPEEGSADELYQQIQSEKQQLIKKGKIKKEKYFPEKTEDEFPFDIPEGWKWLKLEELLLVQPSNGLSPKGVDYQTQYRNLTLTATTSGFFKPDAFKYVDITEKAAEKYYLKDEDILIQRSNSRELVGTSCIYRYGDNLFIYPDLMMRIHLFEGINVDYIDYVLKSPHCRSYYQKSASGTSTSMPKINQSIVKRTMIPLPPLAEQKRIVQKLEEILPLCEKLK